MEINTEELVDLTNEDTQLYNEQRDTQNNSEIETIPVNINEDNHFQTMLFNMISS
ncbi:27950_t:CDS:2, partial [Gigaspora margarita]